MSTAVYDFDGTLIDGDSITQLAVYAFRHHALSFGGLLKTAWTGLCYQLGVLTEDKAKAAGHAFLGQMKPEEREKLLQSFAEELIGKLRPKAAESLRRHRQQGDKILLCSASCACYMRYVAALLKVDGLLCTPSAADGSYLPTNCKGEEKVLRLRQWLAENPGEELICGYGDSRSDVPMLRLCRHAVLVNAGEKAQNALPNAENVNWKE